MGTHGEFDTLEFGDEPEGTKFYCPECGGQDCIVIGGEDEDD